MANLGAAYTALSPGRHKPNGPHYYPALLKPDNYTMSGCDHEDLPFTHFGLVSSSDLYLHNLNFLLKSPNETQYKKTALRNGITKPTIFLGFSPDRILGVPGCFGSDIMHWEHSTLQTYYSHYGEVLSITTQATFLPIGHGLFSTAKPGSSW